MAWCPICKNEYREGFTVCADCKCELVDDLKAYEEKLKKEQKMETEIDETGEKADSEDNENNYLAMEMEVPLSELEEDMEQAEIKPAKKKKEYSAVARYDDYRSSALTFVLIGGLFLIFAFLNLFKVVTLFDNAFTLSVLFLMSIAFLVLGVLSFLKLPELKKLSEAEKEHITKVNEWMEKNLTEETVTFYDKETAPDETEMTEENADELLYLRRIRNIRKTLMEEFPDVKEIVIDKQLEEYYDKTF